MTAILKFLVVPGSVLGAIVRIAVLAGLMMSPSIATIFSPATTGNPVSPAAAYPGVEIPVEAPSEYNAVWIQMYEAVQNELRKGTAEIYWSETQRLYAFIVTDSMLTTPDAVVALIAHQDEVIIIDNWPATVYEIHLIPGSRPVIMATFCLNHRLWPLPPGPTGISCY